MELGKRVVPAFAATAREMHPTGRYVLVAQSFSGHGMRRSLYLLVSSVATACLLLHQCSPRRERRDAVLLVVWRAADIDVALLMCPLCMSYLFPTAVALQYAATRPAGLAGIVLVNGFTSTPLSPLATATLLAAAGPPEWLFRAQPPPEIVARALLGGGSAAAVELARGTFFRVGRTKRRRGFSLLSDTGGFETLVVQEAASLETAT